MWTKISRSFVPFSLLFFALAMPTASLHGQPQAVVSKVRLVTKAGENSVTRVQPGEVLSYEQKKDGRYLVTTQNGHRGWVKEESVAELEDAAPVYDKLIAESPKDSNLFVLRGNVWAVRGDSQKAVDDYSMALRLGEKDADILLRRGVFYANLEKYDEAIQDYNQAAEMGVDDPALRINRAAAFMANDQIDPAIEDYTSVIEADPSHVDALIQRGIAYRATNQWEFAVQDFARAAKLAPTSLAALGHLGFAHYRLGQHDQAIQAFAAVIELSPEDGLAYNNRGFNQQMLGNFAAALADYELAIKFAPTYPLAQQNYAWLLATCPDSKIRDGKKALTAATSLCELREYKVASDLKALAAAHAELGDYDRAIEFQSKVVDMNEGDSKVQEAKILELYRNSKPFRLALK